MLREVVPEYDVVIITGRRGPLRRQQNKNAEWPAAGGKLRDFWLQYMARFRFMYGSMTLILS
jgi:hypothetical protein